MNGVLVVDKPLGPTSHDIVGRARRALGTRRIGHTGTLDPLATGVLPLVVGQATRLAQFLTSDEKAYEADVRFGWSTTTHDADPRGGSEAVEPVDVADDALEAVLARFRGTFLQTPPAFSAKKIEGTPAYRLAREGKPVDLTPVEVSVGSLEIVSNQAGTARLKVVCSSGFYVRVLAHDIGEALGCGAHLAGLRRTRAGSFTVHDAVTLEALEGAGSDARRFLVPMERLLPDVPGVALNDSGVRRASHGNTVTPADIASGMPPGSAPRVRLIDTSGGLLGIATMEPGGVLHPLVVLV